MLKDNANKYPSQANHWSPYKVIEKHTVFIIKNMNASLSSLKDEKLDVETKITDDSSVIRGNNS